MRLALRCPVVAFACLSLATSCGAAPSQPAPTTGATTAPAVVTANAAPTFTTSPTPAAAVALWKVGQSTHDLAARDGSFLNRTMSFGQTLSFTFTKTGRYPYVCMQHEGDGMVGVVAVID